MGVASSTMAPTVSGISNFCQKVLRYFVLGWPFRRGTAVAVEHGQAHAVTVQGQGGQLVGRPQVGNFQLLVAARHQLAFYQALFPHALEQPASIIADQCFVGMQRPEQLPESSNSNKSISPGIPSFQHLSRWM